MIYQGDALTVLRTLPEASVQMCVTSPPYWGLRDYGVPGQLGLEKTPAEYVAGMVAVFEEVRRVLKPDGVLWLNLGDSYAGYHGNANSKVPTSATNGWTNGTNENKRGSALSTLKPKDLIGIPWRVAFALQEAGWYLRCDVIWSKPNPMPESVTDRPTKAHEYIFLLSKSERYFYDSEAIKEPGVYAGLANPYSPPGQTPHSGARSSGGPKHDKQPGHGRRHAGFNDRWDAMERAEQTGVMRNKRSVWNIATRPFTEWGETSRRVHVALDEIDGDTKRTTSPDCPLHGDLAALVPNGSGGEREGGSPSRTERTSVRPDQEPSLGSEPIGSHHAQDSSAGSSGSSVPEHEAPATSHSTGNRRKGRAPATIPPCTPSEKTPACTERIEAGLASSGSVARTSASSTEPVGSGDHPSVQTASHIGDSLSCSCEHYRIVTEQISHFATFPEEIPMLCILAGSRPGDVVLDPFNGAGTTGVVCEKTGRSYIGIELNPAYVAMAERRIANVAPLFSQETA